MYLGYYFRKYESTKVLPYKEAVTEGQRYFRKTSVLYLHTFLEPDRAKPCPTPTPTHFIRCNDVGLPLFETDGASRSYLPTCLGRIQPSA